MGGPAVSGAGSLRALGRRGLRFANRIAQSLDTLAYTDAEQRAAPFMVVGLPRSGTTLAYELLVQAFATSFLTRIYSYTYGMPNLTTRLISKLTRRPQPRYVSTYGRIPGRLVPAENAVFWDRWLPESRELGHYCPADLVTASATAAATETIASMTAIAGRPYVFKNVYMTLSLPALFRLLPDVRAVIVTRDIDAVLASVHRVRASLPTSSWWSIRPPFADDVAGRNALEQTAFQCIRSQQLLEHTQQTLPSERIMVVDYRQICAAPGDFVDAVADWAGPGLSRRADVEIPKEFTYSRGIELSRDVAAELHSYMDSLAASQARYLERIEAFVAERSGNDDT